MFSNQTIPQGFWGLILSATIWMPGISLAQENKEDNTPSPRILAKGVETIVAPQILQSERRAMEKIYALEFAYKQPRFLLVQVPGDNGKIQMKRIWYLAYRVTNRTSKPVLFIPEFTLVSMDTKHVYQDKVMPVALAAIAQREDPNRKWENSANIVDLIPPTPERGPDVSTYGIATWEEVDPKTDYFRILVHGLSNGFKIVTDENGQRQTQRKTLQLNFWRPGDELFEKEEEILPGTFQWIYRAW